MDWKKHSTTLVLGAIIVLMGAEIIYLVYQNRQLKQLLDDPSQLLAKTLQAGDMVPAIRGVDINGGDYSLNYAEAGPWTLVLWFSPNCSSCEDNFAFWNQIEQRRLVENLRLVGFCACNPSEGKGAATAHAIGYPILAITEPTLVDMYKGNLLPQTILIDPGGKITQVWPGALLEQQKSEILSQLENLKTIKPEGGE